MPSYIHDGHTTVPVRMSPGGDQDMPLTTQAQPTDPPDGAIVASAQVSGFDLGRLSPGLQEDIARLASGPLDRASTRTM